MSIYSDYALGYLDEDEFRAACRHEEYMSKVHEAMEEDGDDDDEG